MTDESECQLTELPISMCAHCREKGLYKPSKASGLNLRDIETIQTSDLSIDENGEVWLSPNEAFMRGEFGRGKYLY